MSNRSLASRSRSRSESQSYQTSSLNSLDEESVSLGGGLHLDTEPPPPTTTTPTTGATATGRRRRAHSRSSLTQSSSSEAIITTGDIHHIQHHQHHHQHQPFQSRSSEFNSRSDEFSVVSNGSFNSNATGGGHTTSSRTSIRRPVSRGSLHESDQMKNLTVNKLRFSSVGLHGRDDEVATLLACLQKIIVVVDTPSSTSTSSATSSSCQPSSPSSPSSRRPTNGDHEPEQPPETQPQEQQQQPADATSSPRMETKATTAATTATTTTTGIPSSDEQLQRPRKQLVLLSGAAGTGKTKLAMALKRPVIRKFKGMCIAGNFDPSVASSTTTPRLSSSSSLPTPSVPPPPPSSSLPLPSLSNDTTKHSTSRTFTTTTTTTPAATPPTMREERPYVGIVRACQQLCVQIMKLQGESSESSARSSSRTKGHNNSNNNNNNNPGRTFENIRTQLLQQLPASELHVLTKMLPDLTDIVGTSFGSTTTTTTTTSSSSSTTTSTAASSLGSKHGFHFAFCRFLRILAPLVAPLVLILDDLQWADSASIELLEDILADPRLSNIMCVACFRDDPPPESGAAPVEDGGQQQSMMTIGTRLSNLEQKSQEWGMDVTELSIGSLSVQDVHQIIMELLSTDDLRTLPLAKICHRKTHGNGFYLINFVSMLNKRGLLQYNIGMLKWVWNNEGIELQAQVADNVVDLVQTKLSSLPEGVSRLLQLAACLGASFDESTLYTVVAALEESPSSPLSSSPWSIECHPDKIAPPEDSTTGGGDSRDTSSFDDWMEFAVNEGFLEKVGGQRTSGVRWTHGRIKEAAFSLIPPEQVKSLQSRVGTILATGLTGPELDKIIFVVVDLLNGGSPPVDDADRIRLSQLNLQASLKAAECSALESASQYAAWGIQLLPTDKWANHYDLTLNLYSTAAEIEGALGHYDVLEAQYFKEVVSQTDRPLLDKLRLYNALLDSIAIQDSRGLEAVELCTEVLKQLGCKFPKGKKSMALATLMGLTKVKARIKSRTPEEIATMAVMTDTKRIETMKLLNKLASCCYDTAHGLFPLVVLESLRLTFKYGLSDSAPATFARTGMLLTGVLEDFLGGAVYAQHAMLLMERLRCMEIEAQTLLLTHFFVFPWTRPAQGMAKPLLTAYQTGMEVGDTESALNAIANYLIISFQAGRSILSLEGDCRIYVEQMDQLRRERTSRGSKVTWQLLLNLMGRSENPSVLTGEVMDQEAFLEFASQKTNRGLLLAFYGHQALLFAFFAMHELGAELALAHGGDVSRDLPCHPFVAMSPFYMGISLFDMARTTKQRKYRAAASKCLAAVSKFVKMGNPNSRHHMSLLEAEAAALQGDKYVAMNRYEIAVVLAGRSGFVQDAALIQERFGEFLLRDMSNPLDAAFRLEAAAKLYDEWGARKKAEMMREKYSQIWQPRFGR